MEAPTCTSQVEPDPAKRAAFLLSIAIAGGRYKIPGLLYFAVEKAWPDFHQLVLPRFGEWPACFFEELWSQDQERQRKLAQLSRENLELEGNWPSSWSREGQLHIISGMDGEMDGDADCEYGPDYEMDDPVQDDFY